MKKISFLLLLFACTVLQAMAGPGNGHAKDIATWATHQNTQQEAQQLLGKPNNTRSDEKQTIWEYTSGKESIQLLWDNSSGKLLRCTFNEQSKRGEPWNNNDAALIKLKTPIEEMIAHFGSPVGMQLQNNTAQVLYHYKDATLKMYFLDGKLMRYEMNGV